MVEMSVSQTMQEQQKNFVVILRDVTARKNREKNLAESEARLRTLAQASREGVFIQENGHIVEANPAFFDITGLLREEVIGQPLPSSLKHLLNLQNGELTEDQSYVRKLERQNGEIAFVQIQAHAQNNQDEGQWRAFSLRDISLLRQKEQETASLIQALELIPELICHTNPAGQILYLNQAARQWLYEGEEAQEALPVAEQLFTADTWAKIQAHTTPPPVLVMSGQIRHKAGQNVPARLTLWASADEMSNQHYTVIIQPEAQLS
ncbi:MAG: PAS domain S-box protein [Microscillaceae bacterium]|nr:PAS domain S-box protein [Microscillaceae bacterium]